MVGFGKRGEMGSMKPGAHLIILHSVSADVPDLLVAFVSSDGGETVDSFRGEVAGFGYLCTLALESCGWAIMINNQY